jgi:hypothetical protein
MKLTLNQLAAALNAANEIHQMEAARDIAVDRTVRIICESGLKTAHSPYGAVEMNYTVSKGEICEVLTEGINAQYKVLAAVGIELVPGGSNGG